MEFEQYFVKDLKSYSKTVTEPEKASSSDCFDCSICLEFARDPVVTLCGHLYCWPCIYKWFDSQSNSLDREELPKCPVCKAEISQKTMVPLYGRGKSVSDSGSEAESVPPRPTASSIKALFDPGERVVSRDVRENRRGFANYDSMSVSDHPVVGMFGEMVYARIFGDSRGLYAYPSSYYSVGSGSPRVRRRESGSPRVRRRELEADQSLNRVSIFLLCCLLLCLLLF